MDEEIETQRDKVTCLNSPSQQEGELRLHDKNNMEDYWRKDGLFNK